MLFRWWNYGNYKALPNFLQYILRLYYKAKCDSNAFRKNKSQISRVKR
jgi:hypothetical protein